MIYSGNYFINNVNTTALLQNLVLWPASEIAISKLDIMRQYDEVPSVRYLVKYTSINIIQKQLNLNSVGASGIYHSWLIRLAEYIVEHDNLVLIHKLNNSNFHRILKLKILRKGSVAAFKTFNLDKSKLYINLSLIFIDNNLKLAKYLFPQFSKIFINYIKHHTLDNYNTTHVYIIMQMDIKCIKHTNYANIVSIRLDDEEFYDIVMQNPLEWSFYFKKLVEPINIAPKYKKLMVRWLQCLIEVWEI